MSDSADLVEVELGFVEETENGLASCIRRFASKTAGHRWQLGCIAATASTVVLLCVLGVIAIVGLHNSTPEISSPVYRSSEYQAVLFYGEWDSAEKRVAMTNEYLKIVNEELGTDLSLEDGSVNVRSQFYYTLNGGHRCGSDYDLRVRQYLDGPKAGVRYMDMKAGSHFESLACSNPIWPAEGSPLGLLADWQTRIKCERDVHACDGKYSMSSRVFFDPEMETMPMLQTCDDVRLFYPWALRDMSERQRFHPVTENMKTKYWWVWSYEGYVNADGAATAADSDASTINIDVTLEYEDLDLAKSGDSEVGHSSEFSIKLFERGTQGYDAAVKKNVEAMHSSILDRYGSRGQYEDGVCM